jgi:PAS domain S-box-containing protein
MKKKILLVEDEVFIAFAEQALLERYGCTVLLAHTGERAVELALSTADLDLVLMDINLVPRGMDGIEAAQRILAARDLPLIFLSSHCEREVVERTEGITSYGYIVKNSGETVLVASIKMAFRLFEAKLEARARQERLRASEERFQLIDRASLDAIYSYDLEGRFTHASLSLCSLLGLPYAEIVGKTHAELGFPPEQCAEWERLHREVRETDAAVVRETSTPIQGGETRHFEVLLNPMHDERGVVVGIAGVTREITERKKAENELRAYSRRLRVLFDKSLDAMFLVDIRTGAYLDANHAAEELTGRSAEELRKLKVFDVSPEGAEERLTEVAVADRSREFGTVGYLRPDGSIRRARLSIVPIDAGTAFGIARPD